jgi:hypothetical protein
MTIQSKATGDVMTTAHIDRQKNKTIDGVTFKNTHSGQKKAYGDSFYEYDVTSELPPEDVERVCREKIYKSIPEAQYLEECKANRSADLHFRAFYKFRKRSEGTYFYSVCFPYTD